MRLSKAVELFVSETRVAKSPATATAYESDLRLLVSLSTVDAADTVFAFTPELVWAYFFRLSSKNRSMGTLHRRRASLNEFARWGLGRGLWASNPMVDAPKIKRPKYLPRPFDNDERDRLMALELPPIETVMRALLYYTGLRVSPVCGLRIADVSTSNSPW